MSVIIGSARIGENNSSSGNKAGDASGNEVSTQAFYMHSKGWYILRAKSADVANKIATAMQQACDNNHIGYDQADRGTLLTQYKKYGSIKAITTNCECDCSSLIRVCVYQASGTLVSDFTTSNEVSVLTGSGLFEKKSCSGASDCYQGDILCTKSKGHTVAVVSGGKARTSSSSSSSSGSTSSSTLSVDGQWGKKTTKRLQAVLGTTQDSIVSHQYSSYKSSNPGCLSETFQWESKPSGASDVIKAVQKKVGATVDGHIGPKTIKAMQKHFGTTQDGYISKVSDCVKAMQKALNNGKF